MTNKKQEQIKPCPFCGATDAEPCTDDYSHDVIFCKHCGATGPQGVTQEMAIRHWNTRRGNSNTDFIAAGGLLPPVKLSSEVYVLYRGKPTPARVYYIGINETERFFFNVVQGKIGEGNYRQYQFEENDIGQRVFLSPEEAQRKLNTKDPRVKKK